MISIGESFTEKYSKFFIFLNISLICLFIFLNEELILVKLNELIIHFDL